ncbi:MAG: PAS domain-containing protein [Rhodobacteraceae bacterium]|nr:MAG: PAS domain-containing protein [Paracoccaceae bacterium]
MTRAGAPRFWMLLPLGAILAFAVLLAFSLSRMVQVETDIRVDAEQNMLWVMHQSESAARRLVETTLRAELGEAGAGEVALRLDLLRSRFALLQDGPQARFLREVGLQAEVADLGARLEALAPLPEGVTPAEARDLRLALAPFAGFFARAANVTMIREWDDLGGRLETSRDQLRQIIASLIGITVTGAILTVTLVLALRTSRRRNAMLRRERDFSALLISSSGEGILAVDAAATCTIWNPAMTVLTGRAAEQAVGRKLSDIAGFFDIAPVRQAVAAALAGRATRLARHPYFRDAHAPPLHVDLRVSPMRNQGRVIGAIVFMHDASDRHAARQKEAETRARLEHLVRERTRALDDALQRERSAADLYRNFAGMISHQFRTPLAVADSALQRLIRRGARADAAEIAERATGARQAIAGLTRLVESTLDAARLQAGEIGARRTPCDLAQVLEMVVARQRAAAPGTPIALQAPAGGAAMALCDPAHAEQVLENLLSNAVKYATPGSTVCARLHGDDTAVHCDIRNAGAPIDAADRARLFEANFRGANSTGTRGTGVGLFIARSLARMQGGEVSLHPDAARVTFRLTLPRPGGAPE